MFFVALLLTRWDSVPDGCSDVAYAYSDGAFGYILHMPGGNKTWVDDIRANYICNGKWRQEPVTDQVESFDPEGFTYCLLIGIALGVLSAGTTPLLHCILNKITSMSKTVDSIADELADVHDGVDDLGDGQDKIFKQLLGLTETMTETSLTANSIFSVVTRDDALTPDMLKAQNKQKEDAIAAKKAEIEKLRNEWDEGKRVSSEARRQREAERAEMEKTRKEEDSARKAKKQLITNTALFIWSIVIACTAIVIGTLYGDQVLAGAGKRHFTELKRTGECLAVDTRYAALTEQEANNASVLSRRILSDEEGGGLIGEVPQTPRAVKNADGSITFYTGCGSSFLDAGTNVVWKISSMYEQECEKINSLELKKGGVVRSSACELKVENPSIPREATGYKRLEGWSKFDWGCFGGDFETRAAVWWNIEKTTDKWMKCRQVEKDVKLVRIENGVEEEVAIVHSAFESNVLATLQTGYGCYYIADRKNYFLPSTNYNTNVSSVMLDPYDEVWKDPNKWVPTHIYRDKEGKINWDSSGLTIRFASAIPKCQQIVTVKGAENWTEFLEPCHSVHLGRRDGDSLIQITTVSKDACNVPIKSADGKMKDISVSSSSPATVGEFSRIRCASKGDGNYEACNTIHWTDVEVGEIKDITTEGAEIVSDKDLSGGGFFDGLFSAFNSVDTESSDPIQKIKDIIYIVLIAAVVSLVLYIVFKVRKCMCAGESYGVPMLYQAQQSNEEFYFGQQSKPQAQQVNGQRTRVPYRSDDLEGIFLG